MSETTPASRARGRTTRRAPGLTKEAIARPAGGGEGDRTTASLRVSLSNALAQLERDVEERAGLWSRRAAQIAGVVGEKGGRGERGDAESIAAELSVAIEAAFEAASRRIRALLPESAEAASAEVSGAATDRAEAGADEDTITAEATNAEGELGARVRTLLGAALTRSRAERGAALAASGAVGAIRIRPGVIRAEIAGSRSRPWVSEVRIGALSKGAAAVVRKQLRRAESSDAGAAEALRAAAEAAFPTSASEIRLACECPDPGACKHAVGLLLAMAALSESTPRAVLRWRGVV